MGFINQRLHHGQRLNLFWAEFPLQSLVMNLFWGRDFMVALSAMKN